MKKITGILLMLISYHSFAQNAGEILAQKKTGLKYLTQQVAALQIYIGYAQKGYAIAREGLQLIGDIRKGDVDLHTDYFNSLKMINPNVTTYVKIKGVFSCQVMIINHYKESCKRARECGFFTDKEISYIQSIFTKAADASAEMMVQLTHLLTPGAFEMKDDERLRRIDALHADMLELQTFVQRFSNEVAMLSMLRKQEKQEIETSRQLYKIK